MPVVNLDTTNLLLGIMAAVSVLEAIVLVAMGILAYRAYKQTIQRIHRLEEDKIRPLMDRVDALVTKVDEFVTEVRSVTSTVTRRTEQAASVVARPVTRAVGVARGVLVAFNTFFNHRQAHETWRPSPAGSTPPTTERSEEYDG